jgi:hypothetical protein
MEEWTIVNRRKKDHSESKHIDPSSLQLLIRTRIDKKLTQEKSDTICNFPSNTFKNIESTRCIPTEEQKLLIQQHFNIYLKNR